MPQRARRYHEKHVPAFLPNDWYGEHFANLCGVHPRHLRRAAAIGLVQLATPCPAPNAAAFLGIPEAPALWSYNKVAFWAATSLHGKAFLSEFNSLADRLDTAAASGNRLPDYHRRRAALAHWLIPPQDWQRITTQLRRWTRADYSERKRNTASALVWTKITNGEHLFAPHRRPAASDSGTIRLLARAIDRAWWNIHHEEPGSHYRDMEHLCDQLAGPIAGQIDHAAGDESATDAVTTTAAK